jgi:hypothetical protein
MEHSRGPRVRLEPLLPGDACEALPGGSLNSTTASRAQQVAEPLDSVARRRSCAAPSAWPPWPWSSSPPPPWRCTSPRAPRRSGGRSRRGCLRGPRDRGRPQARAPRPRPQRDRAVERWVPGLPSEGDVALSAARLEVQLDLGRPRRQVRVRGLGLTARRCGCGAATANSDRRTRQTAPGSEPRGPGGRSREPAVLRSARPGAPRLAVRQDASSWWTGSAWGAIAVESLDGSTQRRWLRGGVGVEAAGTLRAAGDAAGAFQLAGAFAKAPSFRLGSRSWICRRRASPGPAGELALRAARRARSGRMRSPRIRRAAERAAPRRAGSPADGCPSTSPGGRQDAAWPRIGAAPS